nr:hypothetical protein [Evansella caseinilytica]
MVRRKTEDFGWKTAETDGKVKTSGGKTGEIDGKNALETTEM